MNDSDSRASSPAAARIDVYWIPLGAGGLGFVRVNGRIYEALKAFLARRPPLQLYHTALEVQLPEERYVIENAWPSPDPHTATRGVVVEGPVFSRRLARLRAFRYEVRRWRNGLIADAREAVAVQTVSRDALQARELLTLVGSVPSAIWGRDELATGEMWNSNSVISWLLSRARVPMDELVPPDGGRAPGWQAGIVAAQRQGVRDQTFERIPDPWSLISSQRPVRSRNAEFTKRAGRPVRVSIRSAVRARLVARLAPSQRSGSGSQRRER